MGTAAEQKTSKALEGSIIETRNGLVCLILLQLSHTCLLVPYGWTGGTDSHEDLRGEVSFNVRRYFSEEPAWSTRPEWFRKKYPKARPTRMFLNPGTFYTWMAFEVSTASVEKNTFKTLAKPEEAAELYKAVKMGYRLIMFPDKSQDIMDRAVDGVLDGVLEGRDYIYLQVAYNNNPIVSARAQIERRITQIKRDAWFEETLSNEVVLDYRGLDLDHLDTDTLIENKYQELIDAGVIEPIPVDECWLDRLSSDQMDRAQEEVLKDFDL